MKLEGNGANIDDFLNDLNFVAATPDDTVEYDPDAINPNADRESESHVLNDDGTVDTSYDVSPTASANDESSVNNEPEEPDTPTEFQAKEPNHVAVQKRTSGVLKVVYIMVAIMAILCTILYIIFSQV